MVDRLKIGYLIIIRGIRPEEIATGGFVWYEITLTIEDRDPIISSVGLP